MFVVQRGNIDVRLDVQFYHPIHEMLESKLNNGAFPVSTVGDICEKITDGPFGSHLKVEEYQETGIPLIRVSNVRSGVVEGDFVFISEEKQMELKRSRVLPSDVLLTKAGAILGYSAVFPEHLREGNITSHLVTIRCKEHIIPEYLAIFFRSLLGQRQIYRWGNKSTRPELNTSEVKRIMVSLPPPNIQNHIVEIVQSAYAQKMQKDQEADALLDSIDDYVLAELGIEVPKVEEKKCFVIYAGEIEGRVDPSAYRLLKTSSVDAVKSSKYKSDLLKDAVVFRKDVITDSFELPYVGLENIESNTGFYVPSGEEKESFNSALKFESGDVLFPKLRPYLNKVHFAQFNGVCSTEFHVLKGKNLNNPYLFAFLRSKLVVNQTTCLMTGNTLPRLQTQDVQNLLIPLPPFDVQEKIADEVMRRQSEAAKLRQEADAIVEEAKRKVERILLEGA